MKISLKRCKRIPTKYRGLKQNRIYELQSSPMNRKQIIDIIVSKTKDCASWSESLEQFDGEYFEIDGDCPVGGIADAILEALSEEKAT